MAKTPSPTRVGFSRRNLLAGGAAAGLGGIAAATAAITTREAPAAAAPLHGTETVPFHGPHQAGVTVAPQAHATFLGLDLNPDADKAALVRLMRTLTDDAARLAGGTEPLADSEPELSQVPARLTVTFGFGPGFVERAGGAKPTWLKPLPAFDIDRLDPAYSDGDLLIEVAADDAVTVAHATRMLLKDSRSTASLRWSQTGFRRAHGSEAAGTTMRNLFGQVDGTANPKPADPDFDRLVWNREGWLAGGTSMVLRRISMDLDKWDRLDRPGREQSMGRTLSNGAPLTGTHEHDEPDFTATTPLGFPVIPEFSHVRRARSENPDERIFRRSFNYNDAPAPGTIANAGLLFASFQADVDRQYVPLQRRLDDLDLLNEWTTPIGSSVFAIPPGCEAGGFIGDTLLA